MIYNDLEYKLIPHGLKVGDDVSYGFNGDWYPDGKVERITKKYLTTSRGRRYYLRTYIDRMWDDEREDYINVEREVFQSLGGGTWTLIKGIHEAQNPHF